MSRGVNKAIIVGNLGQDPELRYMPSGSAAATMSVATSEEWKDKESGEKKSRTEWHRVTLFGRLAEVAGEYLKKGSKVYIEGSLRTNKWTDKEGVERWSTEIIAREMQMLDSAGGSSSRPPHPAEREEGRSGGDGKPPPPDDLDDDIPFVTRDGIY